MSGILRIILNLPSNLFIVLSILILNKAGSGFIDYLWILFEPVILSFCSILTKYWLRVTKWVGIDCDKDKYVVKYSAYISVIIGMFWYGMVLINKEVKTFCFIISTSTLVTLAGEIMELDNILLASEWKKAVQEVKEKIKRLDTVQIVLTVAILCLNAYIFIKAIAA